MTIGAPQVAVVDLNNFKNINDRLELVTCFRSWSSDR